MKFTFFRQIKVGDGAFLTCFVTLLGWNWQVGWTDRPFKKQLTTTCHIGHMTLLKKPVNNAQGETALSHRALKKKKIISVINSNVSAWVCVLTNERSWRSLRIPSKEFFFTTQCFSTKSNKQLSFQEPSLLAVLADCWLVTEHHLRPVSHFRGLSVSYQALFSPAQ